MDVCERYKSAGREGEPLHKPRRPGGRLTSGMGRPLKRATVSTAMSIAFSSICARLCSLHSGRSGQGFGASYVKSPLSFCTAGLGIGCMQRRAVKPQRDGNTRFNDSKAML